MDDDNERIVARKKTVASCDVEALKKCLQEHNGDYIKCQSQIEAFKSSCSLKKPSDSAQRSNEKRIFPSTANLEALREYGEKMRILSKKTTEILLMCLGEGFEREFEHEFGNCEGYLRINNYSLPEKVVMGKDVEGLGMHTDMSCLTIVYQDDAGGLQVRSKDGKWLDIDPCEETLVVNIGDLLNAWSNGKLRSSEHRVILRECRNRNRFSLAFFWCFEDNKVISAPDEVVGDEFRSYKPFLCGDYLKFRENSERGKFEKVGFTVKDFAGI